MVTRQVSGTGDAEPSVGSRHSQRVHGRTPADWREPSMAKGEYGEGDYVVYPTHGVGRVLGVETQQVADITLDLIVIKFEKDRMTLRVPVEKAANSGLRKLSSRKMMDTALTTLKGRSRATPPMCRPRHQEIGHASR